jgi:glycosyltransferase involved in cell wall biosynthesis
MSPPLRIAFVAYRGNMRCGGQGVYLWFLARELARLGHRVDVFVGPPYPDPMPFARRVNELRNHQYWGKWFSKDRRALIPTPRTRLLNPLEFYELAASYIGFLPEPFAFSVRALHAIAAELRAGERYDVVHDVQCLGWGLLGIRALGLPVVTTVHHPLTVDRRSSFLRDRNLREALGTMEFYPVGMQSFVARRVDRLFTSSAVSAHQIERDFGVAPERIRMVANGVDTDLFRPDPAASFAQRAQVSRSEPEASEDHRVGERNPPGARDPHEVLCVGRASDPNKGVAILVEAIAQLPRPVRLTLVDDPHRDNPALQRARALGIEDRVDVVGRVAVDALVALYRRAAVVAVPSLFEGFGLPAAEAMACGTPVVATAAGALPEVVGTAGGGILVRAHSPDALARGLAELLAQPAARAELGALGRKGVVANYSWPSVAKRTAEVYAEVVRSS